MEPFQKSFHMISSLQLKFFYTLKERIYRWILRVGAYGVCLVMVAGLFAQTARAEEVLTVPQSPHPLDAYAIDILKLALKHMDKPYTLEVVEGSYIQSRLVDDVSSGKFDVFWQASDKETEQVLLPVRFPIIRGLLGHRVFIIQPDMQKKFDQVNTLEDLKHFSFGQGSLWPDIEILQSNGLKVVGSSRYEGLFDMLAGGRFDGFPRGVLEPWEELRRFSHLNLVVENSIVLIYKLPFYFYVHEKNHALARELHRALDASLADGSFDEYFYNNPMVNDAINQSNLKNRKAFYLDNPSISRETPLHREDYWLDLQKLK